MYEEFNSWADSGPRCWQFYAQKPPIKFGEIPFEDMKMVRYDKDSSAAALILADFGQSSLVYNQTDGFSFGI